MTDSKPVLRRDFMWGFATAAVQIESGSIESEARSGKEDSVSHNKLEALVSRELTEAQIWDAYSSVPGNISDGTSTYKTCDHLRLWREDLARESECELYRFENFAHSTEMKAVGVNAYRFSVSWSRVIPKGGKDDPVNEKGIEFYNDIIDECTRLGITPFVVGPIPTVLSHSYCLG